MTVAAEEFPTNPAVSSEAPVAVSTTDEISLRDAGIGTAIAAIVVLAGVALALFLRSRPPVAPAH